MKTILIEEDEPCVMNVLRLVLLRAGYSLIEATCGEQAIRRFGESNGNVCLIIADVAPPCSGIGVSLRMKALSPSLKIVLTSGYPRAMWSDEDTALLHAVPSESFQVLAKPFTSSAVLRLVEGLIGAPGDIRTATAAT